MTKPTLVLPKTIRFPEENEVPMNSSVLERLRESKNANIVPGYVFKLKDDNPDNIDLPFEFYAEINIDVHSVYLAIDTDTQNRILLRGDGRIVSGIQTVPPEAGMVGIAAGFSYGVAIDSTGAVRQWGSVPAPLPAGLDNVKAISAAYYGAAAIKKNGELVIWINQ